jgi:hypothetical protein
VDRTTGQGKHQMLCADAIKHLELEWNMWCH